MLESKSKDGYSALLPVSFSCLPQIIGLSHLVMCGAYAATIPPDSWLSVYRLVAGVYYSEGRCRGGCGGGREVMEVVEADERGTGMDACLSAHYC